MGMKEVVGEQLRTLKFITGLPLSIVYDDLHTQATILLGNEQGEFTTIKQSKTYKETLSWMIGFQEGWLLNNRQQQKTIETVEGLLEKVIRVLNKYNVTQTTYCIGILESVINLQKGETNGKKESQE